LPPHPHPRHPKRGHHRTRTRTRTHRITNQRRINRYTTTRDLTWVAGEGSGAGDGEAARRLVMHGGWRSGAPPGYAWVGWRSSAPPGYAWVGAGAQEPPAAAEACTERAGSSPRTGRAPSSPRSEERRV